MKREVKAPEELKTERSARNKGEQGEYGKQA